MMRLFLDTSVILAASRSAAGASAEVVRRAPVNDWSSLVTPYVLAEVTANIDKLAAGATGKWNRLRTTLDLVPDVFTLDRPAIFGPAKDRPILFSALAWADVLLTLDRGDFGNLMGTTFYGLPVLKPGSFLERERAANRLVLS